MAWHLIDLVAHVGFWNVNVTLKAPPADAFACPHQGPTGGDPRFQEGGTAPWRKETAHDAPRLGSASYIIYIYIQIQMYICTYSNIYA